MTNYKIDIRLEGDKFHPSKLKNLIDVPVKILAEYGEIATKGRYKGKSLPYGMALLTFTQNKEDIQLALEYYCSKLLSWNQHMRDSGVEDIIVDVGYYDEAPIEFSISRALMNTFQELNVTLEFHTVSNEVKLEHNTNLIKAFLKKYKNESYLQSIYPQLLHHDFIYDEKALKLLFYLFSKIPESPESIIKNIQSFDNDLEHELEFQNRA